MTATLQEVVRITGAEVLGGIAAGVASGWSIDSRTLAAGDVFFALRGPTHDGHEYEIGRASCRERV